MRWFAPALASVAIVLAVFGARGVVRGLATDASPSQNQTVLGIPGAHAVPAIAERLPEPLGPRSLALGTGAAIAAAGLLIVGAVSRLTDRRALAAATSLRCRRRGPPQLFTV
jgi:hypothetical protein